VILAAILRESLVVASVEELPTTDGHLRITDLRDQPLVMFRAGYDLRDTTLEACRQAGFTPAFTVEGGEMDAVLSLVEAGLGETDFGKANYGPFVDAKTEELRAAHDVLAEFYADRLADALDHMPAERAVLGLFCDLTLAADLGTSVGDVGCGTGRLEPYLAARGLSPRGIDLSPEMIRVARRDHPDFGFDVADLRELPFEDASLAGVVCWYSLMYLAPSDRPAAFSELSRVVRPGGYLVTARSDAGAAAPILASSSTSTGCLRTRWSAG
jgi:hypothetical protein